MNTHGTNSNILYRHLLPLINHFYTGFTYALTKNNSLHFVKELIIKYFNISMASIIEFNKVMHDFLVDLTDVFPENDNIQNSLETFNDLVKINFKKPQQMFMETVGKYADKITKRDEIMFDVLKFPGFSFATIWTDDISAGTKDAIWVYLNQLLYLCKK